MCALYVLTSRREKRGVRVPRRQCQHLATLSRHFMHSFVHPKWHVSQLCMRYECLHERPTLEHRGRTCTLFTLDFKLWSKVAQGYHTTQCVCSIAHTFPPKIQVLLLPARTTLMLWVSTLRRNSLAAWNRMGARVSVCYSTVLIRIRFIILQAKYSYLYWRN